MAVRGEPCIVTQGLTKHYGTKIAVKGDLFADDSALWENA